MRLTSLALNISCVWVDLDVETPLKKTFTHNIPLNRLQYVIAVFYAAEVDKKLF